MSCGDKTPGQPLTKRSVMQHQPYRPVYSSRSGLLQRKWDRTAYEVHRRKVKFALPIVDTYPPKTYRPMPQKVKKLKFGEELPKTIQRGGAVDSRNVHDQKSLHSNKRRQETLRINKENEKNRIRLSQCRSHYEVRIFHQEWLQTLKVRERVTRYPPRAANQSQYQDPGSSYIPWDSDYDNAHGRYKGATHKPVITKTNNMTDAEGSKTTKRNIGRGYGRANGPPGHVNLPRLYVAPAYW